MRIADFVQIKYKNYYRRDNITPYFTHCIKVANLLKSDDDKTVAYLHDIIEDGLATYEEIKSITSKSIANRVLNLSHNKKDSYEEYIKKIKHGNKKIKIADIVSNLSDKPTKKQIIKYNKALNLLIE